MTTATKTPSDWTFKAAIHEIPLLWRNDYKEREETLNKVSEWFVSLAQENLEIARKELAAKQKPWEGKHTLRLDMNSQDGANWTAYDTIEISGERVILKSGSSINDDSSGWTLLLSPTEPRLLEVEWVSRRDPLVGQKHIKERIVVGFKDDQIVSCHWEGNYP